MSSYHAQGLDEIQLERLACFEADLLRWGRAQNLVSRSQPEREIERLLLECVLVGQWLEGQLPSSGQRWADVGSGGGFPGIVFGILYPEHSLDLIERRQGRCDFLRREIRSLGLDSAQVVESDARAVAGAEYSLVSLKAVAPPAEALELAAPLLKVRGRILLFQRPRWTPPTHWKLVDRWVGPSGPVDLSEQAAHLLEAPGGGLGREGGST